MGGKVSDDKCVNLCHRHHMKIHDHGRRMWFFWGIDPSIIIEKLKARYFSESGKMPGRDKI